MTAAPRRKRNSDRLVTPGASPKQMEIDMTLAPFDGACRAMDKKWGTDRLPELVSTESAAKWGKVIAGLNAAIDKEDAVLVAKWADSGKRGLAAMDAEATAAGHKPLPTDVVICECDGYSVAVMPDGRNWEAIRELMPGVELVTPREVALAIWKMRNEIADMAERMRA